MGDSPVGIPPLFVCDTTADGDVLVRSLSSLGYDVFRVPLPLLLNRVEVQKPSVIIIDVDAASALGCAQQVRDIPGSRSIRVLFTGQAGRTLSGDSDAAFFEASGFFPRPISSDDVLDRVENLIGAPPARSAAASGVSSAPQSASTSASPSRPAMSSATGTLEPLPPGSAVASAVPLLRPVDSITPSNSEAGALSLPPVPGSELGGSNQTAWSLDAPVLLPSPELTQLLQDAELRVSNVGNGASHPPPPPRQPRDDEEAILTPEILAALDEPLEFDEEPVEGEPLPWGTRPGTEDGHTGMGTQDVNPPPWRQRSPATNTPEGTEDRAESESGTGTEPPTPTPSLRREPRTTGAAARLPPLPSPIPEAGMDGSDLPPDPEDAIPTPPPPAHAVAAATVAPGPIPRTPALEALAPLPVATMPSLHGLDEPLTRASNRQHSVRTELDETQSPWARGSFVPTHESAEPSRRSFTPLAAGAGTRVDASAPSQPTPTAAPPAAPSTAPSVVPRSPRLRTPKIPEALGRGDSVQALAQAVRSRFTGSIALEDTGGIRRVVLSDGDFVTVASGLDGESLVEFLVRRGDISRDALALGRKLPQFGRHAGAALVAHGHLRQEDLWPVLRTHSEWLLGRCLQIEHGAASLERTLPARLATEPDVFGGSAGAEVFVEVMRRVISPEAALQRLHGRDARIGEVEQHELLDECGLEPTERELVVRGAGDTIVRLVAQAGSSDFASVLYALHELGVVTASAKAVSTAAPAKIGRRESDALDDDAIRARIQRRRTLVDEGDYFSLLGVASDATGYEIRRAYLDLRKELDPSVLLTARTADQSEDLDLVLEVLSEAYDILRDDTRRERYRRALLASPGTP